MSPSKLLKKNSISCISFLNEIDLKFRIAITALKMVAVAEYTSILLPT
jgi:hypothetical protein